MISCTASANNSKYGGLLCVYRIVGCFFYIVIIIVILFYYYNIALNQKNEVDRSTTTMKKKERSAEIAGETNLIICMYIIINSRMCQVERTKLTTTIMFFLSREKGFDFILLLIITYIYSSKIYKFYDVHYFQEVRY